MDAKPVTITRPGRSCGSCNKCCEGWLSGQAYEAAFWPGRKCAYLCDGKCSIYEQRPEDPCKSYRCQWLVNDRVPGWMKPDQINAILTARKRGGIEYLDLQEAGSKLDSEVLSWSVMYALTHNINLRYTVSGGENRIGSQDFLTAQL